MRYGRVAKGRGDDMGGQDKITRNRTMEEGRAQAAWKRGYDDMREAQKSKVGQYNPGTGEREYPAHFSGPRKSMSGERKVMSPEMMAKRIKARRG